MGGGGTAGNESGSPASDSAGAGRGRSPPPAALSSSSTLALMLSYSASTPWPPLIRLRTSWASWVRPLCRSQRGLSGRQMNPMNCSAAGTTDRASMYLDRGPKKAPQEKRPWNPSSTMTSSIFKIQWIRDRIDHCLQGPPGALKAGPFCTIMTSISVLAARWRHLNDNPSIYFLLFVFF